MVVGHTCYGQLGRDLRVRAEFASTNIQQEYDAFRLTILNRTEGKVDQLLLPFRTVWGRKPVNNLNFPKGVIPHIWKDGSEAEWYAYRPTKADMDILRSSCKAYLDVFREPFMASPQRDGGNRKAKRDEKKQINTRKGESNAEQYLCLTKHCTELTGLTAPLRNVFVDNNLVHEAEQKR